MNGIQIKVHNFFSKRYLPNYIGLGLCFFVGIILHTIPVLLFLAKILTPFFLLGLGLFILISELYTLNKRLILWLLSLFVVTMILEITSVHTGLPFGDYVYGHNLGLKLGGVPVVIGFNWVIIILGFCALIKRYIKNIFLIAITVFILSVLFDIILEPLAARLEYWYWQDAVIPLQNYLTWGIIAFCAACCFNLFRIETKDHILSYAIVVQVVYLIILRVYFYFF